MKENVKTHCTLEALAMPLGPQCFHPTIDDKLLTPLTPLRGSLPMTSHTPRIPFFFHKGILGSKRVTAFGAEEMSNVPFAATSDHHFSLDGCFAATASRGKELMEIEVAIEAKRFVGIL